METSTATTEIKSPVLEVRKASGATQVEFAKKLGVGLRSLKRFEIEGRMPRNMAVMRTLRSLAKKHGVDLPEGAEEPSARGD